MRRWKFVAIHLGMAKTPSFSFLLKNQEERNSWVKMKV